MKQYFLFVLALIGLIGCSVYNTDYSRIYGIGSDQWHDQARNR